MRPRWWWILAGFGGLIGWTVLQVLLVRFVEPSSTLTIAERAWAHTWEAGPAWPARQIRGLDELGPHVPRAVLASEDGKFFLHGGFDWDAICDALGENRRKVRGASTISQQVAKNVFLWQNRSWLRKGMEVWYTFLLELLVPKERILELYLNTAETGPMVFGMEAGARYHFGKPAAKLTANEAGRLAAILPDPQDWSVNGATATERSAWIAAHPAPIPTDPNWKIVYDDYARRSHGPWNCLF